MGWNGKSVDSMDAIAENRYPSWLFSITADVSAAVAQWIEYWPPKPRVVGSIPASRAIHFHAFYSSLISLQAWRFLRELLRFLLCPTFLMASTRFRVGT
jgi:hypothetical protein